MLPKPAVSGAPTGPNPGRGGVGGPEGNPGGGLPLSSRHHPLKAVSPSSAALLGRERERLGVGWAGSLEKPPARPPLSSDPRGSAPTAASFPRGEGAAGKSGRSQLGEALIQ